MAGGYFLSVPARKGVTYSKSSPPNVGPCADAADVPEYIHVLLAPRVARCLLPVLRGSRTEYRTRIHQGSICFASVSRCGHLHNHITDPKSRNLNLPELGTNDANSLSSRNAFLIIENQVFFTKELGAMAVARWAEKARSRFSLLHPFHSDQASGPV